MGSIPSGHHGEEERDAEHAAGAEEDNRMDAAVVELRAEEALRGDVHSRSMREEGAEDRDPSLDEEDNILPSEAGEPKAMHVGAVAAQRRLVSVHPPLFAFPHVFRGSPLRYLLEFWGHFLAKPG